MMLRARPSVYVGRTSRVSATHTQLAQKSAKVKTTLFAKGPSTQRNFHKTRRLFADESSKLNQNEAPKIIAGVESEQGHSRQQYTRSQLKLRASLLFFMSLVSLSLAGYLIYNQLNEDDDENEDHQDISLGHQLSQTIKPSTAATHAVETVVEDVTPSVLQTLVQTVKESVQVQAEEDPLEQAAASMPGHSMDNEDIQELQESLMESQKEVSELRQHVRQLQAQLVEQRREANDEAESRLNDLTEKHLQELDDALERKEHEHRQILEDIKTQYQRQTEEAVSHHVAQKEDELMQFFAKKGKERLEKIEDISRVVNAVESAWNSQADYLEQTTRVHQLQSAVNALEAISKKPSAPFHPQLSALAEVGKDDTIVESVLDSFGGTLPTNGAPSVHELRGEFGQVVRDVKSTVYAPNDTGFLGTLFGKAASYLTVPERGLVDGGAPDAVLARAEFFLEHGDLPKAIREVDRLEGDAAVASEAWVSRAKQRLTLEQNIKFLQAHTHDLQSTLGQ